MSRVDVHAGAYRLGYLPGDAADRLRPQLARLTARRKFLAVDAVLHGDDPSTVAVEVFLPLIAG